MVHYHKSWESFGGALQVAGLTCIGLTILAIPGNVAAGDIQSLIVLFVVGLVLFIPGCMVKKYMKNMLSSTLNTRGILWENLRYIRSDVPTQITAGDRRWLLLNDVCTIVDLREEAERVQKPCPLQDMEGFTYLSMPVSGGNKIPASPEEVPLSYFNMVDDQMMKIIQTIESAETNVLFFCNAGKDRTGVVSALLLKRAGMKDDFIIKDYMKSAKNLKKMLEAYAESNPEVDIDVITPKEEYMREFLRMIANSEKI